MLKNKEACFGSNGQEQIDEKKPVFCLSMVVFWGTLKSPNYPIKKTADWDTCVNDCLNTNNCVACAEGTTETECLIFEYYNLTYITKTAFNTKKVALKLEINGAECPASTDPPLFGKPNAYGYIKNVRSTATEKFKSMFYTVTAGLKITYNPCYDDESAVTDGNTFYCVSPSYSEESYVDAKAVCSGKGGELLAITSQTMYDNFKDWIVPLQSTTSYIKMKRLKTCDTSYPSSYNTASPDGTCGKNKLFTTEGTTNQFTAGAWASDYPCNSQCGECLLMSLRGKSAPPYVECGALLGKYRTFQIDQMIAGGGFGQIYRAFNLDTNEEYYSGSLKNFNYIVMEMLGMNLGDIRKSLASRKISKHSAIRIGIQVIDGLELLHSQGFLHRDLKPTNCCVGLGPDRKRIYLVDFGMSRRFRNEDGSHRESRRYCGFRGTTRYCSYRMHDRREQGPVDDLWCLYYTLAELIEGYLPWRSLEAADEMAQAKKIAKHSEIYPSMPTRFASFDRNLRRLRQDSTPNYLKFKDILASCVKFVDTNAEFEWDEEKYNM
ncbi:unnamed protein product [Caenorhabditis bovis]|uniref:non-specific serine/threonine protein kinase n=1 Tax=Caenorhabditis bovis TaxID=2654633 RepID=A0A8S1F287_9PELO|nr:unnamed protein product [Caenorhabditis bovis]